MIVPAYANSTQDNEYMTREQAYHYYNEFLWPERYADCVPMDRALELLKNDIAVYPPARRKLAEHSICCAGRTALLEELR